jgi:hypothetical protein
MVDTPIQIESMMEYLDPDQSEARDRHLKRYISSGQTKVAKSVDEIAAVRADFAQWKKATADILRALEVKAGSFPIPPCRALSD